METKVSYSANLNKVAIDSLRVLLPFDKVVNQSNIDTPSVRVNLETGNTTDEEILKSEKRQFPGTGTEIQFGVIEPIQGNEKKGEKKYYLKVNAKFLNENYLEGITTESLKTIWETSQQIPNFLKFDLETFLQAGHTDTDLKIDYGCDIESSREVIKAIYNITPEENKHYVQQYNKRTNLGIEFNQRQKAKPKHPYLKWYNKQIELNLPKNIWLRDTLIKKFGSVPEILRYEFNFKTNDTWKKNGLQKPQTLEQLCEYIKTDEVKKFILEAPDKLYIMKAKREKAMTQKTEGDIIESPIEFMIRAMAEDHLENGKGRNYFLSIVDRYERTYGVSKNDSRPRRLQAMIKILLEGMDTPDQKKRLEVTTKAEEILKQFGLF